ncbi:MAG: nucleotidyltransferase [candidate division Zixibacteria bacterium]|nr:nucleotidyltransferase [candidate division Zixibacteria bacterium]
MNRAKISYMVIGGQAVLVYGEPRLTKDIDIALGVGVDGLEKIQELTSRLKLKMLPKSPREFVKKTMTLPALEEKSGIRVDFIFSFSPYERQAIERARAVRFGRSTVKFAALEDLVIHKLIAGRPRDIEDVKSVLLKNPRYNRAYLVGWLKKFDDSLAGNLLKTFKALEKELG